MVPATRPLHALYMFECFIFGDDVCKTFKFPVDDLEYLTGAVTSTDGLSLWQSRTSRDAGVLLAVFALAVLVFGTVLRGVRSRKAQYTRIYT
ncbi:hypothetical protein SDRG_09635 [Saprolegnia diclina VS20]|uniref:Uncharacterized protein n=1 Tax=Saprolegnia diclina (strain VS20) TaxID=1156394 RepID=T0Q497_SAPDV|nr:hypothetical protein SDRG_09635 [Saprolegnia diclina VS20]EQC32659.1 hypothetical protein SDRG_09635 [Saprolegnia diclina VS20]|eukprot:XP_008613803.1 hypothetical protein SDRG_09635 [Saprolegnia diclina VS20]